MDAATTAFLSSRIQKWDFSEFLIPDITKRKNIKKSLIFCNMIGYIYVPSLTKYKYLIFR